MTDTQHYLVVPDSPDEAMTLDHPAGCPQHNHIDTVYTADGGYACPLEEERRERGLEASFDRLNNPVPLFMEAPIRVRPGRYPVEIGLRLTRGPLIQPEVATDGA